MNLSEQDFMENEKLLWGPSYYGDSGDSLTDLQHAATYGYKFAYEDNGITTRLIRSPIPKGF